MATGLSRSDRGFQSTVYLIKWMEGRMRKKLAMLAVNMRV
jgi:hypothetical protein